MINLTKEQINALTNVIYDQVKDAAKAKVAEAKKASMEAEEFKELHSRFNELKARYNKAQKEINSISNEFKEILKTYHIGVGYYSGFPSWTKTDLFNRYCDAKELEFPKVSKDRIKDDITVKTIEAIDVDSIVESIKKKYIG